MTEKTKGAEGEIAEELKRLGRQLHATTRAAWESEERHQLEAEMISGLNALASEIERALGEFRASPEGEALKAKAREVKGKAESGELGMEARHTFLRVLRQINAELDGLQRSWSSAEKAGEEKE